jgi:hypothetical protein
MYAGMTRRVYNTILTHHTDSTQFGISNDNFKAADSSSAGAGASTAPATTTASVNIKTPISAQAVSASDAVTSAASSAASVIASASSSAASVISSASSAISSAAVSCLCFPIHFNLSDFLLSPQLLPWHPANTALPLEPYPVPSPAVPAP